MNAPPRDLVFAGGALRYLPGRVLEPGEALFDPAQSSARPVGTGGRQAAWYMCVAGLGSAVLRHYRRGGLVARLSRDRYFWTGAARTRSFAEFNLLYFMHEQGLPVPQPLAASYWRARFTYRAALITELIPNASTLAGALERCPVGAVAGAIYAMHEAGVWHADLNAFNILIDGEGKVWLVDFDRGRRCVMGPGRRKANLLRLRRSLIKTADAAGERAWEEINRAYAVLAVGSKAENAL